MTVAAGAVGIEALEALAIVLAVGVERRMRDALIGAAAAVVAVVALGAAVGPALLSGADLSALRLVVGTLLLLFGLEWLRKGILRMAGLRRRSSSYEEYVDERALLASTPGGARDWAARLVAFKGVFLEGLEVGVIVLALAGSGDRALPALLGAALALVAVVGIGLLVHAPLRRLPETQLKLGVGVALTAFGTFFAAEGLHVEWPLGDAALLYLGAGYAAFDGLPRGCSPRSAVRRRRSRRDRVPALAALAPPGRDLDDPARGGRLAPARGGPALRAPGPPVARGRRLRARGAGRGDAHGRALVRPLRPSLRFPASTSRSSRR